VSDPADYVLVAGGMLGDLEVHATACSGRARRDELGRLTGCSSDCQRGRCRAPVRLQLAVDGDLPGLRQLLPGHAGGDTRANPGQREAHPALDGELAQVQRVGLPGSGRGTRPGNLARATHSASVMADWIVASATVGAAAVIGHLPARLEPGGWASPGPSR
jgi:bacterioferritin-associated ferredoxin